MSEGRNYAGTCIDNHEGKVYVVAGCLTKKTSTAEVYDMNTSKWTKIANTLVKRDSLGLISVPRFGQIFGIGGYNNRLKEYLNSAEKYLPGRPNISYSFSTITYYLILRHFRNI